MSNSKQRSILITGCSSGIGRNAALSLSKEGWRVFATARNESDLKTLTKAGCEALYLDYRDPSSIEACAREVLERTNNKLYAVFNNGAYGQAGAVEDIPVDVLRDQFEVNVFGWHDLTNRLIPSMRKNNEGRIIQCSSVLGFIALRYRGAYNASKFALEGLNDTLRLELAGTNVFVSMIEPGPITSKFRETARANFIKTIKIAGSVHEESYRARIDEMEKTSKATFELGPDAVTKKLRHALLASRPKARYGVTFPTHMMRVLKRILPTSWLDRILVGILE